MLRDALMASQYADDKPRLPPWAKWTLITAGLFIAFGVLFVAIMFSYIRSLGTMP